MDSNNTSSSSGDDSVHVLQDDENSGPVAGGKKIKVVHPRFQEIQEFLDLKTDLYLKLLHPTKNYTHLNLMPGFPEKKKTKAAEEFKQNVLQTLN